MNDSERLNLQKMIQANDAENNTHLIRNLKHSKLIIEDVDNLLKLNLYFLMGLSSTWKYDSEEYARMGLLS